MDSKRHKRIRLLVSGINRERKKQAKKIDILCNDLITAQKGFIERLSAIAFAAYFYKSIIGITDLNDLFYTAGKLIKAEIPDINTAFFLRQQDNFKLYMPESDQPITLEKQQLENCFNCELVDNICKSNKLCTLEEMFAMGLQANPTAMNKISAITIPLGRSGRSLGFILIYRLSENKLTQAETDQIAAIAPGLSQAVGAFQETLHFVD